MVPDAPCVPTFREAFLVWLRIGLLGFGGPAGQIALMHRELVEKRRWISDARFVQALNFCLLLPGPEAQQLAVHIGWLLHRALGGLVAGVLFVLPGALAIGALSWFYVAHGTTSFATGIFFGLKCAVLALIADALRRLGKRTLATPALRVLAVLAFVAMFAFDLAFPWIVVGAALFGALLHRAPPASQNAASEGDYIVDRLIETGEARHLAPSLRRSALVLIGGALLWIAPVALIAARLGPDHLLTREGVFFGQAAVLTFGGAYAVLAFVAQRAVEDFAWLQPQQMIDGLALAETTPGPLILVVQFVGFVAAWQAPAPFAPLAAATLGAALVLWVTFVPSFVLVFAGAPWIESLRAKPRLSAALAAIGAAVCGAILHLALWFAIHVLFGETFELGAMTLPRLATIDLAAVALAFAAGIALLRFRVPLGWVLAACALTGVLLRDA